MLPDDEAGTVATYEDRRQWRFSDLSRTQPAAEKFTIESFRELKRDFVVVEIGADQKQQIVGAVDAAPPSKMPEFVPRLGSSSTGLRWLLIANLLFVVVFLVILFRRWRKSRSRTQGGTKQ